MGKAEDNVTNMWMSDEEFVLHQAKVVKKLTDDGVHILAVMTIVAVGNGVMCMTHSHERAAFRACSTSQSTSSSLVAMGKMVTRTRTTPDVLDHF